MNNLSSAKLDKFYTLPDVAGACWGELSKVMQELNLPMEEYHFVEPSAGCGGFYQLLPKARRLGLDLEPQIVDGIDGDGIHRVDYLTWQPRGARKKYIVIGNPPFGKRGNLAVKFFNHSAFADFIAFIVPVSFRKHFIHRSLLKNYALIKRKPLDKTSFHLPDGKKYAVNTEFQIWTRLPCDLPNHRELKPAPTSHPDFAMHQYNNTREALKVFDNPFDFAVPCQGYQDYQRKETDREKCETNKQWILFHTDKNSVRKQLHEIDFHALAYDCATITPGFRKNDVVRSYAALAGSGVGGDTPQASCLISA